ncbi:islet amyloid polypeptide [Monodon monoceros]|uniref:islet amyloid polypeptide n=1 Tax=Monodon monoceros TaxID=40151 RepID=UPI0010F657E9|nr:islet amyloid polypeptide [Monodon monoceros]
MNKTDIQTSHQMEKRKCYTATCATQRLENFLVWSSNNLGVIFSPTKVGSNTYGKRNTDDILKREPLNYLLPLERKLPLSPSDVALDHTL